MMLSNRIECLALFSFLAFSFYLLAKKNNLKSGLGLVV